MADTFDGIATRVMPYVQEAYAGTLLGYDAALGYGLPEYNAAAAAARDAARRIADAATRQDVVQLALLICAHLIGTGYTPQHAGREAVRRAWLVEAPEHHYNGGTDVPTVPAAPEDLQTLETTYQNNRPALTDAAYATRSADFFAYALQCLPALELALVQSYAAVDAHQSTRLPVAAMVRDLMQNAPHVAQELGLTDGLPTGRRAMAFSARVRDALQMLADAYTDTLHHDSHDSRRRCSRPAPLLYVLPERAGSPTRVPLFADTPGPRLQIGYVTVPATEVGTMARWHRASRAEQQEQRAADHAATSSALTSSARPIPGVRPGIAYGHAVAGTGTAQRVQASRKRKRDGGIGSPMV